VTDPCKSTSRLLGAHVDGQLDTVKTLEVEDHLAACETCRERIALDRAIRGSLKKSVRQSAPAEKMEAMRVRLLAKMLEAESVDAAFESAPTKAVPLPVSTRETREKSQQNEKTRTPPAFLRHWRTALPLASAAAIALAWGVAGSQPLTSRSATDRAHAGFGNDDLLNQFVGVHSRPLRPETQDPKEVRAFERDVGVPVRLPQFQKGVIARTDGREGPKTEVRFVGGRLLPVQGGERAAMLQYEVQQGADVKRVSVFIYDPRRVQVGNPNFAARPIGTAKVQVGQAGGYSVAVAEHRGVGYAVASELDADATANLVGAADAE
jgi:anti-sigma factor RsiW